jgi:hypothetical protein
MIGFTLSNNNTCPASYGGQHMDIQVELWTPWNWMDMTPKKTKSLSLSLSLSQSLEFQSFVNQTMMFLGDRFTWWSLLVIAGLGNMVELVLGDVWHDLVVTSDVQILVSFWDWAMIANIIVMGFVVHLILWSHASKLCVLTFWIFLL